MTRLALLVALALLAVAVLLGRRTRREPTASAGLAKQSLGRWPHAFAEDWADPAMDVYDGIQPPDPGLTMRMKETP